MQWTFFFDFVKVCCITVIILGDGLSDPYEAVCISFCVNVIRKVINPFVVLPSMCK